MKTIKRHLCSTITLIVAIAALQTSGAAQNGDSDKSEPELRSNAQHSRIVGLWDVVVTNRNCDTGAPMATFLGLHKYELGGTAQTVPATNPAATSAHMGVWEWVRRDEYKLAFKMFRFNTTGTPIGWNVVRFNVEIDPDAGTYVGTGISEVYDINGNLLVIACPTFEGSRFQ